MTTPDVAADREYIAQFESATLGIVVNVSGIPQDADGNAVTATLYNQDASASVFTRSADHPETGSYSVTLSSEDTITPGSYTLTFSYSIDTQPQTYVLYVYIGAADPAYNALAEPYRDIIESVNERFADTFDSTGGGVNLLMKFQSHFGRGRMARLLKIALNRINMLSQPVQTYTVDGSSMFPVAQWGGLLEFALYVEVLKHLMRSYTEQPEVLLGGNVSRFDRRDYVQRWQTILEIEQQDLERMLETYKIQFMFGPPRVLVAGGLFGALVPNTVTGSMEGRPRWYPVLH